MADAAIGGKTGVDHAAGKNLLGAFHPPRAVLDRPRRRRRRCPTATTARGLVEAFKAAWIADAELADARGATRSTAILARDEPAARSICSPARRASRPAIVSADPREADRRRLLNFGHTLGHAFEAAGGYRQLRHGEAVAWGIAAALEISRERAGPSRRRTLARVRACRSRRLGPFPSRSATRRRWRRFSPATRRRQRAGIAGVLLEAIGRARVDEAIPLDSGWRPRPASVCEMGLGRGKPSAL